jgi:3-isopropylmalate dehydrogenase
MKTYQIAVLSGDGIGPEIVDGALQVLETLQKQVGLFNLDYQFFEAGAVCYQKTGENISIQTLQTIEKADAIFKGAAGLPGVRKSDGTEAGMLGGVLRNGFDLYANLRPMRLFPNTATPLKNKAADSIDYYFLRENKRFGLTTAGRIDGKMKTAIKAFQDELKKV